MSNANNTKLNKEEIRRLVDKLNMARKSYEQEDREIMSNAEYDRLYDELEELEAESGIVFSDSPTVNVGYEVLSSLEKETHASPMLSLEKTKDREALAAWLRSHEENEGQNEGQSVQSGANTASRKGLLSWKLDGLTVVLTYSGGELEKAVTRGNGTVGEVITSNAKAFQNIPLKIPFKGKLIIRGEAVIKYSDFEEINRTIPETESRYKNPRNLCSGAVRQLDSSITLARKVNFYAFAVIESDAGAAGEPETAGAPASNSRAEKFEWLKTQGFEVVEYKEVTAETVADEVGNFEKAISDYDIPSDGLVLTLDDIEYSRGLGSTAKFPRDAIAFKWKDETRTTKLKYIEWSASRTGLINPVAVFEPVELEGTTVSRASVHNVSILEELRLGEGDEIEVYKANMIIPQILENHTCSANIKIPDACPACGGETKIKDDAGVRVLTCPNENCLAKHIKAVTHFVSRNAMDIEGISEATIEKFVNLGYIRQLADVFRLEKHREEIAAMEGFGEKSSENIIRAADMARKADPARLLFGLGINNIGLATAKMIAKAAGNDFEKIMAMTEEELVAIEGIGDVLAKGYVEYFADAGKRAAVEEILKEVDFKEAMAEAAKVEAARSEAGDRLGGKTFVITGSLNHHANRDELKEIIENYGGKTAGSVSKKTSYLINNDSQSQSSKNKKAKELGVEIITEEQFMDMIK